MSAGDFLMLAYVLIGWGLNVSNGMYDAKAYMLMFGGFILLAMGIVLLHVRKTRASALPSLSVLLLGLLSFLSLNLTSLTPAMYLRWTVYGNHFRTAIMVLLPIIPLLFVPWQPLMRVRPYAVFAIVLIAFAFRLVLPFASPEPIIDVFAMSQQSSRHLLQGRNPYVAHIRDVYEGRGREKLGYVIKHYTYPPASLYPQAAAFALTGDVRYVFVAAEGIFLFILWWLGRKRWPAELLQLLMLLFLFHPRGLFVLEHGWTEPLLLCSLALFVLLWSRNKRTAALMTYGYFLAIKQYTVFFALPLLILERNWRRLLLVALTALATFLPFALWDGKSLWEQGILFQFLAPYRPDSLSLANVLRPWVGELSMIWSTFTGATMTIMTSWLLRRHGMRGFLQACTLTFGAILVLGSWAFANYYYFLSGMILLTVVISVGQVFLSGDRGSRSGGLKKS